MEENGYIKFLEDTVKELSSDLKAATDCLAALSIRKTREMDGLMRKIDDTIRQSKYSLDKIENSEVAMNGIH